MRVIKFSHCKEALCDLLDFPEKSRLLIHVLCHFKLFGIHLS